MTTKQRTWGQFATPIDVADLLLGFCLRRPGDRLLDPSCGDGALLRRAARWQSWLSSSAAPGAAGTLVGIELDPEAAAVAAAIPDATILRANFLTLAPPASDALFDAVVGNPPYTRAEWIARLDAAEGQLSLFPDGDARPAAPRAGLLPAGLSALLGRRAGLYAYFFLQSLPFLRQGGRLGFVVPNGWLDVAYGAALKQFLLNHFRVLAVIESDVERWFASAGVNTCLVILERAADPAARAANRVRFVRLRRPLRDLLASPTGDPSRAGAVERLVGRLLPAADRPGEDVAVRVRTQGTLAAGDRWGNLLRAPAVYLRSPSPALAPLGHWAIVQRGFTTGANEFFYLDPRLVARWAIEPEFRRPLLKSLRGIAALRLTVADSDHDLLDVPAAAHMAGTGAAAYLAWGEGQGIDRRGTCAARRPWYALPHQPPGDLLLPKGVWQRHFAPLAAPLAVDQQIYRVRLAEGVLPGAAAALLNSAWFALQCELRGRVNLGEGVLWLATYELAALPLPDPRTLEPGQALELAEAFDRLAARPVVATAADLDQPDRRALDDIVFDLAGLTPAEGNAARAALRDALTVRRQRAKQVTRDE